MANGDITLPSGATWKTPGTIIMSVNAGSASLTSAGAVAVQTYGGSASLAVRVGATTYYFTPAGTV